MLAADTLAHLDNLDNVDVAQELDCRGDLCPLPVYKASMALGRLDHGQVLRLLCTDPGSVVDIPALARQAGHTLLGHLQRDEDQIFWLQKGGGA